MTLEQAGQDQGAPTPPLLDVRGLEISYRRRGREFKAVHGVDLAVSRGTTVGLVGESGSGKSSIGSAILGLTPASGGTITYDGVDITRATRSERRELARRIQVVFQDPYGSMNPTRTIGDTITESLRYNLGVKGGDVEAKLRQVLHDVGLPPRAAERYPRQFSGGQRQRIAIARALVMDPEMIVCDEPTSALDLSVQAQVLNLLMSLKEARGLSYLFITHDLPVVRYLSDEIVVLRGGRVVERGPARRIATAPAETYTRALLMAAPVPDPAEQRQRRLERRRLLDAAANA